MAYAQEQPHSRPDRQSSGTEHALREEIAHLQQAVRSHAPIDQAIGVLIAVGRISPEEAWDILRETSMNTNTKLRELAAMVIDSARTGHVNSQIAAALTARLHPTARSGEGTGRERNAPP